MLLLISFLELFSRLWQYSGSNFSLQTPLYYRQFVWSQKCQKSYILYLYNTDTFVKRTLGSVPLVSVLKRFNCSYFEIMRAYSSEGNHGSRLCFTWWIITSQWIFSQSQWKNLNDKLQHYFISTMSHTISMVLQTHKEAWTKYLW